MHQDVDYSFLENRNVDVGLIDKYISVITKEFDIQREDIFRKSNRRKYTIPRNALNYLTVKKSEMSCYGMGVYLRMHTSTVRNSVFRAEALYDYDKEFREKLDKILVSLAVKEGIKE